MDSLALKCSISTLPYCGTYVFNQNTKLYGCYSYDSVSDNISPLSQYFSSVLGPDYTTRLTQTTSTPPETYTDKPTDITTGDYPQGTTPAQPSPTYTTPPPPKPSTGLGGGAIAGIAVGCVAGVSAILIAIWWFILRKKDDKTPAPDTAYTQNNNMPTTGMNPQGYNQAPHAAGGYYAPVEQKPAVDEQLPTYPNEQKVSPFTQPPQQPPQPQHAEMPGSNVSSPQQQMSPIPSELASTPMSATHNGPVPEQIYEMGPGR